MTFLTNIANILAKYWQVFLVQGIGYTLLLSVGIMLVTLLLAEVWRVMKIRRVDIKNR